MVRDRRAEWLALATTHTRHWWARDPANRYVPPAFAMLTTAEWDLMREWFAATGDWPGEMNVPALGVLQGLIEGGGIRRVVELGRYEGYGTLLLGFMLRRMGAVGGLVSFDVAERQTASARAWVDRAGLGDYVRLELGDSRDPANVTIAWDYFGHRAPQLIFLDTFHARDQTVTELELWYEHLAPGGLILLHDSSRYAHKWDATGDGGVRAGVYEWLATRPAWPHPPRYLGLNDDLYEPGEGVYQDDNGLGILAKPLRP